MKFIKVKDDIGVNHLINLSNINHVTDAGKSKTRVWFGVFETSIKIDLSLNEFQKLIDN